MLVDLNFNFQTVCSSEYPLFCNERASTLMIAVLQGIIFDSDVDLNESFGQVEKSRTWAWVSPKG